MDSTAPPVRATADLRLLVGGLVAWLTALATLVLPVSFGIVIGVLSFVGAAGAMASRRTSAATVTLVLGCVGAAALATALRLAAAASSPLAALAQERASITADLVLSEDPQPLRPGSGPPRVATAARIEHLVAGDRGWSLSAR